MKKLLFIAFVLGLAQSVFAQSQATADDYTRYELLEPSTQSFRILYEVTATKAGTIYYYNALRKGSEHKVDSVKDLRTGRKLEWSIVSGVDAKKAGYLEADETGEYLQVQLAHAIA
ncbi:MAG: hypothetical protein WAU36_10880, partial [Cyclobacteriaceae bacterium]